MPELPEVENVRRTLLAAVEGQRVLRVTVHRADIVTLSPHDEHASRSAAGSASTPAPTPKTRQPHRSASRPEPTPRAAESTIEQHLLLGRRLTGCVRHGKQLALLGSPNQSDPPTACVVVHLGMTGALRYQTFADAQHGQNIKTTKGATKKQSVPPKPPKTIGKVQNKSAKARSATRDPHVHVVWTLEQGVLQFRDPRRFGGLWTFPSLDDVLHYRWNRLGPDALLVKPKALWNRLQRTTRAIKAVLLDQHVVAGLGNIYVDELLHRLGIHPLQPADTLNLKQTQRLVPQMRQLLDRAIEAGGSTLRDYTDAAGDAGGFQFAHKVYGRADQPCYACGASLVGSTVAGRSTVHCQVCQALGS